MPATLSAVYPELVEGFERPIRISLKMKKDNLWILMALNKEIQIPIELTNLETEIILKIENRVRHHLTAAK